DALPIYGDAGDRGEQDELLAQRVERPDVEVERGDDVRRVAQLRLDLVHQQPVDAVVVAERRQAVQPDQEDHPEPGPGDREHRQPGPATHCSSSSRDRSCWPIFRSAARLITGSPTAETTISDSPTSGAWKAKN